MRERSESRERNDDWNRDDDRFHEREREEEEKIPVWTRRRPTGFDVMPEGKKNDYFLLCFMRFDYSLFVCVSLSLSLDNSFVLRFSPNLAASFSFPFPGTQKTDAR
jgi:hypothetical protein